MSLNKKTWDRTSVSWLIQRRDRFPMSPTFHLHCVGIVTPLMTSLWLPAAQVSHLDKTMSKGRRDFLHFSSSGGRSCSQKTPKRLALLSCWPGLDHMPLSKLTPLANGMGSPCLFEQFTQELPLHHARKVGNLNTIRVDDKGRRALGHSTVWMEFSIWRSWWNLHSGKHLWIFT